MEHLLRMPERHSWLVFVFVQFLTFFSPLLVDKMEISLQRLQRLPYLPSCHIIATPFPTPHEVFVVAVLCSGHVPLRAAVELLEKSWLKMVRCVTWWVFHNSLQKPGKQLAYTHAHNTFRNMCTCEHVNKAPVILSGWGVCGAGRLKIPEYGNTCIRGTKNTKHFNFRNCFLGQYNATCWWHSCWG